jgi:putative protein-disulfide isomerase
MRKIVLFYVHDPMCSWCWGFSRARESLFSQLPADIEIRRLLGGLAADNDDPMPVNMRRYVQETWRTIEKTIPGTRFNFDFWKVCRPRRSTYPACRAVIAARQQGSQYDEAMTARIQQAYYREARNPSEIETLVELAAELGLDALQFKKDLNSAVTSDTLMTEIQMAAGMQVDSMPGLVLKIDESTWPLAIDYVDANSMLEAIEAIQQIQPAD